MNNYSNKPDPQVQGSLGSLKLSTTPDESAPVSSSLNTSALTSNHVVMVLGLGLGSDHFIRELLASGVRLVVLDKSPVISDELLHQGQSSGLLTVLPHDFSDLNAVEDAITSYHVKHTLAFPVGRALTFLGQINDRHDFLGPRLQAIDTCTDKVKFHQLLQEHGLTNPRYMVLPPRTELAAENTTHRNGLTADEIKQTIAILGLPLVIKPSFGSGSMGVWFCTSESDLQQYVVPERFASQPLLVDAAIEGTEYLVNLFIDDHGDSHLIGLYAKEMSPLPYRQEVAYFADDYNVAYAQMYPYLQKLVAALGKGVHNSFFQCDLILAPNGDSYAIDVSPRLTGNAIVLLEQLCGCSPIKTFVSYILKGQALPPTGTFPVPPQAAVLRFFSFEHHGTVTAINPTLSPEELSHVALVENNISIGDSVGPMTDGQSLARGLILTSAPTLKEANDISLNYLSSFVLDH